MASDTEPMNMSQHTAWLNVVRHRRNVANPSRVQVFLFLYTDNKDRQPQARVMVRSSMWKFLEIVQIVRKKESKVDSPRYDDTVSTFEGG